MTNYRVPGLRLGPTQRAIYNHIMARTGAPDYVITQIMGGMYLPAHRDGHRGIAYIAGPMRGIPHFNFPEFDRVRDLLLLQGYVTISPADIDRQAQDLHPASDPSAGVDASDQRTYVLRDFYSLYYLTPPTDMVVLLDGWEGSTGASAEKALAEWLGLSVTYAHSLAPVTVDVPITPEEVASRPPAFAEDTPVTATEVEDRHDAYINRGNASLPEDDHDGQW